MLKQNVFFLLVVCSFLFSNCKKEEINPNSQTKLPPKPIRVKHSMSVYVDTFGIGGWKANEIRMNYEMVTFDETDIDSLKIELNLYENNKIRSFQINVSDSLYGNKIFHAGSIIAKKNGKLWLRTVPIVLGYEEKILGFKYLVSYKYKGYWFILPLEERRDPFSYESAIGTLIGVMSICTNINICECQKSMDYFSIDF